MGWGGGVRGGLQPYQLRTDYVTFSVKTFMIRAATLEKTLQDNAVDVVFKLVNRFQLVTFFYNISLSFRFYSD